MTIAFFSLISHFVSWQYTCSEGEKGKDGGKETGACGKTDCLDDLCSIVNTSRSRMPQPSDAQSITLDAATIRKGSDPGSADPDTLPPKPLFRLSRFDIYTLSCLHIKLPTRRCWLPLKKRKAQPSNADIPSLHGSTNTSLELLSPHIKVFTRLETLSLTAAAADNASVSRLAAQPPTPLGATSPSASDRVLQVTSIPRE